LKYIKLADFAIAAAAIAVAIYMIAGASYADGYKKLTLINEDEKIPIEWGDQRFSIYEMTGKKMILEVADSKARVISSDCPDQVCVNSGWISECGHIAACLPNGVMLMVECSDNFKITE
jgi:hypothetical protein